MKKIKKSVDIGLIVWYIINCLPEIPEDKEDYVL